MNNFGCKMAIRLYFDSLRLAIRNVENMLAFWISGPKYPSGELCVASIAENPCIPNPSIKIEDIIKDGFLYAVPKKRRTIERRMCRKYGWKDDVWKLIRPKTNLIVCNNCGHNYEPGYLCPTCYSRILEETTTMQEAIEAELGLDPVDKEVVVLYKGERELQSEEFWQGKRIVEIDRERPAWFTKNLLQKTTQGLSTSTDVKPTELA